MGAAGARVRPSSPTSARDGVIVSGRGEEEENGQGQRQWWAARWGERGRRRRDPGREKAAGGRQLATCCVGSGVSVVLTFSAIIHTHRIAK